MSGWVASILQWALPILIRLIITIGLPALVEKYPGLKPIVEELLKVLKGAEPSSSLRSAGDHYNTCQGVACMTQPKGLA